MAGEDDAVFRSILHDSHVAAEAEFQDYAGVPIVATFGEPQAEYGALHTAAGLFDEPHRGVIELTGPDRLPFLNNLLTNQTFDKSAKTRMPDGTAIYAFLLNAKTGRIMTDIVAVEVGGRTLLLLDARLTGEVAKVLERYRFAEKVVITDRAGELHTMSLHGPGSGALLTKSGLNEPPRSMRSVAGRLFGFESVVVRRDVAGVPGFTIVVASADARAVWRGFVAWSVVEPGEHAGKRPLRPVGWAALNATRIEAGRPLFGIDFDDTLLPAETGLFDEAVSVIKGCYPGQEVVARMHARQQVARKLVGLRMADDALPVAGSPVQDDAGNIVGGDYEQHCFACSVERRPGVSAGEEALLRDRHGVERPGRGEDEAGNRF